MAKKNTKQSIKDKVKAKAKQVKEKLKGAKKCGKCCAIAVALLALSGCMGTNPASRATSNTEGDADVEVVVKSSSNCTVTAYITHGDGALASADSAGSTETQTATPTLDIRTRIDARYNDALAAASSASRSVLGTIGDGITGVLDLMQSKKSGTVQVTKTDGTQATVQCEGGQCEYVPEE